MQQSPYIGHTHIIMPIGPMETASAVALLPVLWRWYLTLPEWGEIIAAPAVAASAALG